MTETTDLLIMWAVILARLLVPLTIPRYPLPGVIASSLLDMVDYTIIRDRTNLPMEGYQGFDKGLDVYYLTVAYISTLRNWTNLFAFKLSRFLFYWRLGGVVLFELTQLRPLLFIFTNAFEYVFMFYEAMRLRWDPKKMSKWVIVGATAFIWIFIKLPQEYILHIGQFDTTVWVDAFFYALRTSFWVKLALVALVAVVVVFVRWLFQRLPPADYAPNLAADPLPAASAGGSGVKAGSRRFFDSVLIEKIVMVALVSIIFGQILPDSRASNLQIAIGVAFVIIVNTALSHWLARRGFGWASTLRQFIVMAAVNFGLIVIYALLLPNFDGAINLGNTLFFALLLTLLVTLYDLYRPVYEQRVADEGG